jgi:hypothetical protein
VTKSRRITSTGEIRNENKILDEKSEGKRALESPKYRWEDNIKIYFR